MAKRSTDLLEVFRKERGGGKPSPGRRRRGEKRPRTRRRLADFEGVFLTPRQVLLVSCVLVLLIVLAFTAGLGIGKRGPVDADPGAALQRTQGSDGPPAGWYIWAAVSKNHLGTARPVDPAHIVEDLGLPGEYVYVENGTESTYDVYVGPWGSKEEAEAYLERTNLGVIEVQGSRPFNLARIRRRQ